MEMFGTQSDFHINLPYIGLDYTEQEIEDAIRLKIFPTKSMQMVIWQR